MRVLVIKGESKYNVLRLAADETAKGFALAGCEVDTLDLLDPGISNAMILKKIMSDEYTFVFSPQLMLFDTRFKDGSGIFDHSETPWAGWIFDDILFHAGKMLSAKKNARIFSVDGAAGEIVRQMRLSCVSPEMLLHGGFEPEHEPRLTEKDIDILVPCTVGEPPKWLSEPSEIEKEIADKAIGRWMLNPTVSAREAVREELEARGEKLEGELYRELSNVIFYTTAYMRYVCRKTILDAVVKTEFNIHLIGQDTSQRPYPPNVIVHGAMDISDVVALMARSKILVNPFPNVYEKGAHERIFTALLCKCVCFSPDYSFLHTLLGNRINYINLLDPEGMNRELQNVLTDYDNQLERLDDNREYAIQNHTWKQRGTELADRMKKVL